MTCHKVAGPTIQEQDAPGIDQLRKYAKFFPADPAVRSVARLGPELGDVLVSIKMMAIATESG